MNTILIQTKASTLAQVSRHNYVAASLRDAEIFESRRDLPTWSYVKLVVTRCFGPASSIISVNRFPISRRSRGITLIEILLALGLTVLITGLIGGLIQIYQGHLEIARDNVRQARLARAVLTMIADDIRGVLRVQSNDDNKTLETFLMSSAASSVKGGGKQGGGQQGGGQQGGGQQGGGQQGGGQQGGGQQGGGQQGGGQQGSGGGEPGAESGGSAAASTDPALADPTTAPLPPGIYGTDMAIEVDISRPPRPDEYIPEMQNLMESKVTDVPSDTKTVSYYIQSPQLGGIQDALSSAVGVGPISGGGLIRRSLDRAVTRWALEQGNIDQISNTGHLLASEIIAISFSYFDGLQWTTTWDSSVQGLPWAIQITIAMQHARQARENPLTPGVTLESLMALPTSETGIETFSTLALVPGAQLLTTPAEKAAADSSTSSPTSSLGF